MRDIDTQSRPSHVDSHCVSGIGKSSLINLLIPNLNTRVRELVRVANIGSHTTSNTRLYHLPPLSGTTSPTAPAEQEPDDNDEPHDYNDETQDSEDTDNPNGCILDSPGIRELGLWHLPDSAILEGFNEIRHHAKGCKFRNCRHSAREARFCNVQRAVHEGLILPERYSNFAELTNVEL